MDNHLPPCFDLCNCFKNQFFVIFFKNPVFYIFFKNQVFVCPLDIGLCSFMLIYDAFYDIFRLVSIIFRM